MEEYENAFLYYGMMGISNGKALVALRQGGS